AAAAVFLLTLTLVSRVAEAVGNGLLLTGPPQPELRQWCLGSLGVSAGLAVLLFFRLVGLLFTDAPEALDPTEPLRQGGLFNLFLVLLGVLDYVLAWGRAFLLQFCLYQFAVHLRRPDLSASLLLSLKILAGGAGGALVLLFLLCGGA